MKEYIEHEAAIAVIEEKQKELCPVGMYSRHAVYGSDREKFDAWEEIIEAIEAIPAADVRPVVRAHWKSVPHKRARVCSRCEADEPYKFADDDANVYNFCPNCGADMREES